MGGYIKITVREEEKIETAILDTFFLDEVLLDFKNIFETNLSPMIEEHKKNRGLIDRYAVEDKVLAPFSYGYIFIDRVDKKVWFINDYQPQSCFTNFDFDFDTYQQVKNSNFEMSVSNAKGDSIKKYSVLKNHKYIRMARLKEYVQLYSALQYAKTLTICNEDVESNDIVEILDKLMESRKLKKKDKKSSDDFSFDVDIELYIKEFKDWSFYDRNNEKSSYEDLFKHLEDNKLLTENDLIYWNEFKK